MSAIREEHKFTFELSEAEISVVAPMRVAAESLFEHQSFRFAVYPRQGGHPPNLENADDLEVLARTIGRMHAVGSSAAFAHRPALTCQRLGNDSRSFLLEHDFVPADIEPAYASVTEHLLQRIEPLLASLPAIRVHARAERHCCPAQPPTHGVHGRQSPAPLEHLRHTFPA